MSLTRWGAILVFAGSICAIILYFAMGRHPDPPGADGYYYLKQIERLSSGQGYYYKDHSLAFLLPALAARFTGDPLLAFRLATALTASLLVIASAIVASIFLASSTAAHLRSNRLLVSILAALCSSLGIYELTFEYYKNATSLLLLMGALIAYYSTMNGPRWNLLMSFALVGAALITHKSAIFFVTVFTALWCVARLSRRNTVLALGVGAASIAIFLLSFEKADRYLIALPTFIEGPGQWFTWVLHTLRNDPSLSLAMGITLVAIPVYALYRNNFSSGIRILTDTYIAVVAAALIPFFTAGPSGPAYRVILLSPLVTIPLLFICTVQSKHGIPARIALAVLCLSTAILDHGRIGDHIPHWSRMDDDITLVIRHVTQRDHLIAHHGLEFYVDYRTGIRARQFLAAAPGKRSFRLAYVPDGRPSGPARDALNNLKLEQIGDSYVLIEEEGWKNLVARYQIKPHWKNPDAVKPDYIPDYE